MAQSRAESTWDIYNYGKYINQFLPNKIKALRQYKRIKKKICRQKISIIFKEICIIYTYIYICIHSIPQPWEGCDTRSFFKSFPGCPTSLFYNLPMGKGWIHTVPKGIFVKRNVNNLIQDLHLVSMA